MVGELFSACDATFSALERVVITTGPGAFTGVRVGIAFAKGLRVATGAMLVGVSSLECLAVQAQAAHPGVRTGVVIDARRDEVYVLVRDPDGRHVVAAGLLPVGDAERALLQACDRPMLLFGTGRNLLNLPDVVCPAHDISEIDAVQLGQFGRRVDPVLHPVTPAYLRAPDARLPA
jgi:tRNA threonylcarbamoyladenosine biosynthesis protein TsaB